MTFTETDLLQITVVALTYLIILPIQLVIFPSSYYSVRDIIYSKSFKKASMALASRAIFIFFLALIAERLCNIQSTLIVIGIGLGSFLTNWPSIYHYQLFAFIRNPYKLLYLLSCILSIAFSIACSVLCVREILPLLFEERQPYLFTNDAIPLILQVLGIAAPSFLGPILNKAERHNPYIDTDTFPADLFLTKQKMFFEKRFINDYHNEIVNSASDNNIPVEFLQNIILLELINRKSIIRTLAEKFVCYVFPSWAMKKNITVGLAQISMKIASEYYEIAPQRFARRILKPEENIEVCAYYLHDLTLRYPDATFVYKNEWDIDYMNERQKYAYYIASQYLCGCNVSRKKFTNIYATILYNGDLPDIDEGNG